MNGLPNTIVKLMVKNHPGAMSHITGLFSRRAFNLEGILCAPVERGEASNGEAASESAMYLLVRNDDRLEQIVKQLRKLYDVNSVSVHTDLFLPHQFTEDGKPLPPTDFKGLLAMMLGALEG
jgi:acetolactate synthase-1/3 small subunit